MSTLLFLHGTTTNNNNTKKYDQFIPTYANHTLKSPPRVKKRKRQASNGSSKEQQQQQRRRPPPPLSSSSQVSTINDMSSMYAPPSPTSSFSSFTSTSSSSSLSSSHALSPLSFNSGGISGEDARKSPCHHDEKRKQLISLENEMDFTQDAWATLNVMFESVRLAYLNCAPKLTPHPTRLDAMEKELLSAYDDLELQVIHLDRHIQKLETSWYRYKTTTTTTNKLAYALTPPSPPI